MDTLLSLEEEVEGGGTGGEGGEGRGGVNKQDNSGWAPLHYASHLSSLDVILVLLSNSDLSLRTNQQVNINSRGRGKKKKEWQCMEIILTPN